MKLDSDKVVSISAILIGLCSLFMVVYQTVLLREEQRASVLPYLMVALMLNRDGAYVLINNTGIGPALIDDVKVVNVDGSEFDGDIYDFLQVQTLPPQARPTDVDRLTEGRLLPAGITVRTVGSLAPGQEALMRELLRHFDFVDAPDSWYLEAGYDPLQKRAVLQIDYASVYGERWRIRSDSTVPQAL